MKVAWQALYKPATTARPLTCVLCYQWTVASTYQWSIGNIVVSGSRPARRIANVRALDGLNCTLPSAVGKLNGLLLRFCHLAALHELQLQTRH